MTGARSATASTGTAPRWEDLGHGLDEHRRRRGDDVHVHRPPDRLCRESRRRVGARNDDHERAGRAGCGNRGELRVRVLGGRLAFRLRTGRRLVCHLQQSRGLRPLGRWRAHLPRPCDRHGRNHGSDSGRPVLDRREPDSTSAPAANSAAAREPGSRAACEDDSEDRPHRHCAPRRPPRHAGIGRPSRSRRRGRALRFRRERRAGRRQRTRHRVRRTRQRRCSREGRCARRDRLRRGRRPGLCGPSRPHYRRLRARSAPSQAQVTGPTTIGARGHCRS
jgi:hypothetical protein